MDVTAHHIPSGETCIVTVGGDDTVLRLKKSILDALSLTEVRGICLRFDGSDLPLGDDDDKVSNTALEAGDTVNLVYTRASIKEGVMPLEHGIYALALSPCDGYLAVTHVPNCVTLFRTATAEKLWTAEQTTDHLTPAFSMCSRWVSFEKIRDGTTVDVVDVVTGVVKQSLQGSCTAWSPCGTYHITFCKSKLLVYCADTGEVVRVVEDSAWADHDLELFNLAVTERYAVCCIQNDIVLYDYILGVRHATMSGHTLPVTYADISPDRKLIASCSVDADVRIWDIDRKKCIHTIRDVRSYDVVLCSHSRNVVVSNGHTITVWSYEPTLEYVSRHEVGGHTTEHGVAITKCGDFLFLPNQHGVNVVYLG